MKQLVILIDDLDRLLPENAMKLFEAIRFYLKIPRTLVILGINDKVLSSHIYTYYKFDQKSENTGESGCQHDEFIEKLFDHSFELSRREFEPAYILKIHFDNITEKHHEGLINFFKAHKLDGLSHRKWKKLSNRIESMAVGTESLSLVDTRAACFKELFPKAERFLRTFPAILHDMAQRGYEKLEDDEIKERLIKIIEYDKAFFNFPKRNFLAIFSIEGGGEIAPV
jgi:hypothetical protein